jgi:hypothetical protein
MELGKAGSIADRMDAPIRQGDAFLDAAEALWLAGDHADAIRQAERAASFFSRKGATNAVARARAPIDSIEHDLGDEPERPS